MVRRTKRENAPAAYTLVDLSGLDEEDRKELLEDANAGGGEYGIRVVEEVINGGARAPLYGYYRGGEAEEKWNAAKKEFGISSSKVDDGAVGAGAAGDVIDPRREAALREAAALRVEQEADRIRAGEESELTAILGEGSETVRSGANSATDNHPSNIVDTTLDPGATNEVADAENQEAPKAPKAKTKTPR